MKTQRHDNERGVALILTLTILAIILILLMAFVTSMRTERIAARAFSDATKARFMAEGAVDEAVALLQSSMTNITATTSYITAPGSVYTRSGSSPWAETQLYSAGNGSVDLNTSNYITGINGAYPLSGVPIQAKWLDLSTPGANPELIGRFAYWVDDESAKVNVNLAESKLKDPSGYTPAALDMTLPQLFGGASGNSIINYVTGTRTLDTLESLKLINTITFAKFLQNRFYVTVNSTSPDLTPWGSKRINLATVLANTVSPTQPQKAAAINVVAGQLATNSVSTWFGKSFADKYTAANLPQIAANIVDYISKDNIPSDSGSSADTTPPQYLGLKQTPYINELVVNNQFTITLDPSRAPNGGTLTVSTTVSAELWYMYTNSAWTVSLVNKPWIYVMNIPALGLTGGAGNQSITFNNGATIQTGGAVGIKTMAAGPGSAAGTYLAVSTATPIQNSFSLSDVNAPILARLNQGKITAIFSSPQGRMDYAQVAFTPVQKQVSSGGSLSWTAECNDPRVKPISNNWKQNASGGNTLGTKNSSLNIGSGGPSLPGDGVNDMSCHIYSSNPGTTGRQRGAMYPSELAYIHTGIPWRTVWLEPQPGTEGGSIPDWLMVDMFSNTDTTNVPGRLNINSQLNNSTAFPASANRTAPLAALVAGNATLMKNIYSFNVNSTPASPAFAQGTFTTAGQICEVKGLADGGGLKASREAPAQAVVNLVTPRSDIFTIWAIAQSIKKVQKVPKTFVVGTDLVTGEVKVQAIVQRYEVPNSVPGILPTVRFRTLYYRYIYQ